MGTTSSQLSATQSQRDTARKEESMGESIQITPKLRKVGRYLDSAGSAVAGSEETKQKKKRKKKEKHRSGDNVSGDAPGEERHVSHPSAANGDTVALYAAPPDVDDVAASSQLLHETAASSPVKRRARFDPSISKKKKKRRLDGEGGGAGGGGVLDNIAEVDETRDRIRKPDVPESIREKTRNGDGPDQVGLQGADVHGTEKYERKAKRKKRRLERLLAGQIEEVPETQESAQLQVSETFESMAGSTKRRSIMPPIDHTDIVWETQDTLAENLRRKKSRKSTGVSFEPPVPEKDTALDVENVANDAYEHDKASDAVVTRRAQHDDQLTADRAHHRKSKKRRHGANRPHESGELPTAMSNTRKVSMNHDAHLKKNVVSIGTAEEQASPFRHKKRTGSNAGVDHKDSALPIPPKSTEDVQTLGEQKVRSSRDVKKLKTHHAEPSPDKKEGRQRKMTGSGFEVALDDWDDALVRENARSNGTRNEMPETAEPRKVKKRKHRLSGGTSEERSAKRLKKSTREPDLDRNSLPEQSANALDDARTKPRKRSRDSKQAAGDPDSERGQHRVASEAPAAEPGTPERPEEHVKQRKKTRTSNLTIDPTTFPDSGAFEPKEVEI
ncbi:hypothetical protein LTR28_005115, partial [Elasticomyces elasticus]